uniref:Uncharacterized protein n=1 Tax=Equus caballus TaxID=9796 RepID=A0A3Q2KRV0_HORSE
MRVPGDIVSALLQGHRARWAGLGVAASGGRGGRPARDGAAGQARPQNQPRARAQRSAHGPGSDLAPGGNQGQGRLPDARGALLNRMHVPPQGQQEPQNAPRPLHLDELNKPTGGVSV